MAALVGGPNEFSPVQTSQKQRSRADSFWPWLIISGLMAIIMGAFDRPLQIDEVLHYALAAFQPGEVLGVIQQSTIGINHGQTGVMMVADYVLLRLTGPETWALRLPTVLGTFLLLVSAVQFMRLRSFSWHWQALTVLALIGNINLIYHAGVARPYMLLAACTIGTFTYYQARVQDAANLRIMGWTSVVVGCLIQPYFPVMWLLVLVFSLYFRVARNRQRLGFRSAISIANPALLVTGLALYLSISVATWLRKPRSFDFDPLASWNGSVLGLLRSFVGNHLGSFGEMSLAPGLPPVAIFAVGCLSILLITAFVWARAKWTFEMTQALVLLTAGIATSALFSLLSVRQSYWIVPRQWVAGMALASVAIVWFFAEFSRTNHQYFARITTGFFTVTIILAAAFSLVNRYSEWRENSSYWESLSRETRTSQQAFDQSPDNDGWVNIANLEILRREGFSPIFRDIYE